MASHPPFAPVPPSPESDPALAVERLRRQRARNKMVLALVLGVMALFYALTIVRMTPMQTANAILSGNPEDRR